MAEHVGIGGIGQGTITLPRLDAPAQLSGFGCAPRRPKIVVVLPQVAHRLRADTAGPHIPIGRDLRRGNPCQAGDHLPLLHQGTLDNVIIPVTERLRDARHTTKLGVPNTLLQAFDHRLVLLDGRRDAHAYRVQLHPLFRDLADVGVGFELVAHKGVDVLKLVDIEGGDHRMHPQREVFITPFQGFQPGIGTHGTLEIALDAAHDVMFFAHAIQRQVDDHIAGGSGLQHAFDAIGDDLILNAIGGDVDDAGPAMAIGGGDHLGQVFAQRRFAPAKGEPVGITANGGKGFVVLLQGEVIVGPLPHVTGFTARVAAITDANREIHGQGQRFAQRVGCLHLRDLW